MKRAVRLKLTGNMQSMSFRQFIKDNADKLSVKGFLRNMEDGSVEIFVEGKMEDVNSMIELCKTGPKFVSVRTFDVKEEKMQDFKEFKIFKF